MKKKMIKIEKKNEKNEKNIWLQGESNPGLLACLAEALPLDQGVNWILAEKKLMQYDLWSQQIFVKILLTQETSTMCYIQQITSRSPRLQTFLRNCCAVQNYSRVWSTVIGKNTNHVWLARLLQVNFFQRVFPNHGTYLFGP